MALKAVRVRTGGNARALKVGLARYDLRDPYYLVLTLSWPAFFGLVLAFYGVANLFFAALYSLDPSSVEGVHQDRFFLDRFFFSVETLATVGYGRLTPGDLYGHSLSSLELVFGLILAAMITGLVFARFSRPKARLLFSEVAVISPYSEVATISPDKSALMVRVVSERNQAIADATARMTLLCESRAPTGNVVRRFTDLTLVRCFSPAVSLSWTLVHVIDETSPFWSKSAEDLEREDASLFVSIGGYDQGISAQIVDWKTYHSKSILHGYAFEHIMTDAPDGTVILDLTRFHQTRKVQVGMV